MLISQALSGDVARYINGHAKAHYEERQPLHCLCLDCNNLSVYW